MNDPDVQDVFTELMKMIPIRIRRLGRERIEALANALGVKSDDVFERSFSLGRPVVKVMVRVTGRSYTGPEVMTLEDAANLIRVQPHSLRCYMTNSLKQHVVNCVDPATGNPDTITLTRIQ